MANELLTSVMSPESQGRTMAPGGTAAVTPPPVSMARRLDTLENKTIYLIDNGFGGGHEFMLELQKWFSVHMPSVKTIARRKTGHVFQDDTTDLWDEIKAKGNAVVYGVAG
jgi:hypothetical protein